MKNFNIKILLTVLCLNACALSASDTTLGDGANVDTTHSTSTQSSKTKLTTPKPQDGDKKQEPGWFSKKCSTGWKYAKKPLKIKNWANGSEWVVTRIPNGVDFALSYIPGLKATYSKEVDGKMVSVPEKEALDAEGYRNKGCEGDYTGKYRRENLVKFGTNATTIAACIIAGIATFKYFTAEEEENSSENSGEQTPITE